jgi:hypothetical protein
MWLEDLSAGTGMKRLAIISGSVIALATATPAFADDLTGNWLFDTSKFADNDCQISGRITFKAPSVKDTYPCELESEQICGKLNFNLYIRVQQSCTAQRIGKQVAIQTKVDKILEVRPKDYPTNYLADNFIVQLSKNLQEMNGQHYDAQRQLSAHFWRGAKPLSKSDATPAPR